MSDLMSFFLTALIATLKSGSYEEEAKNTLPKLPVPRTLELMLYFLLI